MFGIRSITIIVTVILLTLLLALMIKLDSGKLNLNNSHTRTMEYVNYDYGFSLQLPEKIALSNNFQVNTSTNKYDMGIGIEFIIGEVDSNNIYSGGIIFEILVSDKRLSNQGYFFLGQRHSKNYYFIYRDEIIESTSFNEINEKYKPYIKEIRVSFKFI